MAGSAPERLQKILAQAGIASRRAAEQLIADGRIRVNGRVVTELGSKAVLGKDAIEVDGRRLTREKPVYYLLHKPREVVSTVDDPEGRPTVRGLLKRVPERVFPVGRLDYHTSGALLLTNDGELAEALLHPRQKVPKVYAAKVQGQVDVPELDRLRNGVVLDDGTKTRPAEVFVIREDGNTTWVQLTLREGKNRQIHRMFDALGRRVSRLARISFAEIPTDGLRPGEYRELGARELEKLKKHYLTPHRQRKRKAAARQAADEGEAGG
ncbi:MAG TPA: pseudouridine synthase [Polyangiaceae bacterium LLY-WYZ-14_1]|nr:pseudouridine synthase [Polyangiaceae bacterium LLY-WYZ-14_1]